MKHRQQLALFFIIVTFIVSENVPLCCAQAASDTLKPVYAIIQNKLFEISLTVTPIGVFPCAVSQRAFGVLYASHGTEFLYWGTVKQKLIVADQRLNTIKELVMPGSSVWIQATMILVVSRIWKNGFTFSLYKFQNWHHGK